MKPESFELYHKSGQKRTIRLKAWGIASRRDVLRTNSGGVPYITLSKQFAIDHRQRGQKVVPLIVTIKAAPSKKTG